MIDTIDSRDTEFTIDTYNTFTLDNEYEMEIDYLHEENERFTAEYGLPEFDDKEFFVDDYVDFEYDMNGYREALAIASIDYIKELDQDNEKIFNSIGFNNTQSPREYNFTTDSYTMEIDYDNSKMQEWIQDNSAYFENYLNENSNLDFHLIKKGFLERKENYIDSLYSVQLLAYLDFLYNSENEFDSPYLYEMFDRVHGQEFISWKIQDDKIEECEKRKADYAAHQLFLQTQTKLFN
jgi:hypothetical protein